MKLTLLISIALFITANSFGQKSEIDLFCSKLDSSLTDENIILHSVRHKTDFTDARYIDHFYIDTSTNLLLKGIYEFNFEGDDEYIEYYYKESKIIKIYAKNYFEERKISGSFYFKSGKLIDHIEGEIDGKIAFDVDHMLKTGNEYISNFTTILMSLKSQTQLPSAANKWLFASVATTTNLGDSRLPGLGSSGSNTTRH